MSQASNQQVRPKLISIAGFRGSTKRYELDFDLKKPICMIFAENGSGKSTIIDAFDVICNNYVGSLARFSGSPPSHAVSANGKLKDLEITLVTESGSVTTSVVPRSGTPTRQAGRPRAHILRRPQLMEFLVAPPHKRYDALKSFIDLEQIEKAEEGLCDAIKQLEQQLSAESTMQARAAGDLRQQHKEQCNDPTLYWRKWSEQEATTDITKLQADTTSAAAFDDAYDLLANLTDALSALASQVSVAEAALSIAKEELLAESVKGADSIVAILTETKSYLLAQADASECPVCERPINAPELSLKIDERLAGLQAVKAASDRVVAAKQALSTRLAMQTAKQSELANQVHAFDALVNVRPPSAEEPRVFEINLPVSAEEAEAAPISPAVALAAARLRVDGYATPIITIRAQLDSNRTRLNLHSTVSRTFDGMVKAEANRVELEGQRKWAQKLVDLIVKHRKEFANGLLGRVSGDIQRLYGQIHPDEPIGNLLLGLDDEERRSVITSSTFHNLVGVPPQSYYSESHLDTLGLCAFIALAERQALPGDLLILDDVLTSCDKQHLRRVIKVIEDEAKLFGKVIITTHYRPWRDSYRLGRANASMVQLIELRKWTLPAGISHERTQLAAEELADELATDPLSRQEVASKGGVLLEAILDRIAQMYKCRTPHRKEDLTLRDYFDSFNKELKSWLEVEDADDEGVSQRTELGGYIDQLQAMTYIRNEAGSHFVDDESAGNDEVKEFGDAVLSLAKLLSCRHCGVMPYSPKDGSSWRCKCGQLALHPLKQPDSKRPRTVAATGADP